MSEDKFEKYLRDNKPSEPDGENFILELNSKISSVEGIKECIEKERQLNKSRILTALLIGFACGIVIESLILLAPTSIFEIPEKFLLLLDKWELPILIAAAGITTALSYLLTNNDKKNYRASSIISINSSKCSAS